MAKPRHSLWLAALAICALSAGALAQENASSEVDPGFQNADNFDLELFAPTAPAFVTLGLSPRRMADPGAFRDIEIDLANVSGSSRNKYGAAISGTPYWWGHSDTTIKGYQDSTTALERIWARTEVSLAAAYVTTKPADFYNFGFAVQSQLLDRQDHRLDSESYRCLTQAWETYRRPASQAAADAALAELLANPNATEEQIKAARDRALGLAPSGDFERARRACRAEAGRRALGKASLMLGFGLSSRTSNTSFDGWRYDGGAVWTAHRQPLVSDGFLSLELFSQYRFDGVLDVPEKASATLVTGNEITAGSGLALERNRWKLDGAVSYVKQSYDNSLLPSDDYAVGVVRAAIKLRQGLWVQGSVGNSAGRSFGNDPFFSFNIRFDWDELTR